MVTPGTVVCPKKGCGEDRPTLITVIDDPMGRRYFCCVCSHEFKEGLRTPVEVSTKAKD